MKKFMRKKLAIVALFASVLSSKTCFANEKQHDTAIIADSNVSQNRNINKIQTKPLPIRIAAGVTLLGMAGLTVFLFHKLYQEIKNKSEQEKIIFKKINEYEKTVKEAFLDIPSGDFEKAWKEYLYNGEILEKFTPEIKSRIKLEYLNKEVLPDYLYIHIYKISSYLKLYKESAFVSHDLSSKTLSFKFQNIVLLCKEREEKLVSFYSFAYNYFTINDDGSITVSVYIGDKNEYGNELICKFKLENKK